MTNIPEIELVRDPESGELIPEIWKSLPYCNYYIVSNYGRVWTTERPVKNSQGFGHKIHKPKPVALTDNGHGYKLFGTKFNGKKKNFYIHRVVAELFLPNPNNLPEVNHKKGIKSRNHEIDLEWIDIAGNRKHASDNDLIRFGENAPNVKLTESQVIEILEIADKNPRVNRKKLCKQYDVADTVICRIISGKRWRRTWKKFHESRLAIDQSRETI